MDIKNEIKKVEQEMKNIEAQVQAKQQELSQLNVQYIKLIGNKELLENFLEKDES